jgi:hypothetical protein
MPAGHLEPLDATERRSRRPAASKASEAATESEKDSQSSKDKSKSEAFSDINIDTWVRREKKTCNACLLQAEPLYAHDMPTNRTSLSRQ